MKPDPLRLLILGYGLALFAGAATGLTGWSLLLALWLGGPALVLSLGLLPALLPGPVAFAAPDDPDLAQWDADLAAERAGAAPDQPVPAAAVPDGASGTVSARAAGSGLG